MTSIHTPGPWLAEIDEYEGNEPTGWINGPDGRPIVEYYGCGSHKADWNNPKDKQLALAAPDLLDALRAMLQEFVGNDLSGWDKGSAVDKAVTAIKKAADEPAGD